VAGLPTDAFFFAGFLPQKAAARRARIAELAAVPGTLVLFEAPHRLAASLADLAAGLGDRPAALARELTKRFETVDAAPLSELAARHAGATKGEIVVLVGPPPKAAAPDEAEVDALLAEALERMPASAAAADVARATGLGRRALYRRALAMKGE
jgi:16S rRNA (cytidine1402-2'-O)-methyltransferase